MTIPTIITPSQYENAMLAVNRENGDHWIFWAKNASTVFDRHLWLCRDQSAVNESYHDLERAEVNSVDVTDENGNTVEIEAWTFKASQKYVNCLDLEALAEGKVKWL
jgi:hypothetical protein